MSGAADNRFYRETPPAGVVVGSFTPAVDRTGHELWLGVNGEVECVAVGEGDEPGAGWVRLYRAAANQNEPGS